ncbi:MAG: hypothetical protein EOP22_06845 [Hyphomicrobiales bacterium]|nr:MAG: hypothetical protein EOP22_06845 [Hyphomicrobiales bacterium]
MDTISDPADRSREITTLYLGLMAALAGASLPAIRSALAMAVLMTGENSGLDGDDLVAWIDQTGDEAKAVLGSPHAPRH